VRPDHEHPDRAAARTLRVLLDAQELALHEAIQAAFDLVQQAAFLAVVVTSSPALSARPSATAAARQSLPA
jgi:hypothetical protein